MDGSVAEGISSSPQTCPPPSEDLYELFAPEGLPAASPSISHLHVNDLGLTPSPGSQQEQQQELSATHVLSRDEEHGWSDGRAAVTDKPAAKDPAQLAEGLSIATGDEFFDPLFDADFALQDLESDFLSHKRAHDEAFPEDFSSGESPEKRRAQDAPNSTDTPPSEIPSLSPNSTHRTDQTETALNTPAGIEGSQTPTSFFESLDLLFQDPPVPASFDHLPIRLDNATSNALESTHTPSASVQSTATLPSTSDHTKQRFSLIDQDFAANASRETLQRADNVPQYVSPYPEYGGPLGYLPSTPGLHAKCIEVVDERMNYRLECLRQKNQQLTAERNKYKNFWEYFSVVDIETGKTKQDVIQDENSMLRRVSTRHQTRAEEYKKEVEHWKGRLNEVATLYNNLLYEITVLRKLPEVTPPPAGYRPQSALGVAVQHPPQLQPSIFPGRPVPDQHPAAMGKQHPQPGPVAQYPLGAAQPCHPRSDPTCPPAPVPTSVTIDLTEDDNDTAPNGAASESSKTEALQSLRQKRYHWLEGQSVVPSATSERRSPTAPLTTVPSISQSSAQNTVYDGTEGDELARMMEEELARGS